MADLPVAFSAAMVRAILREIEQPGSGKTQTRRALDMPDQPFNSIFNDDGVWSIGDAEDDPARVAKIPVRYRVDDRLYVREAWRAQDAFDDLSPAEIGQQFKDETGAAWCPVFYEADQQCDGSSVDIWQQSPPGRLRQGMHMPRWASRITLIVTDVRVQRLQEISNEDAIAEGPGFVGKITGEVCESVAAHRTGIGPRWRTPRDWYADLWDSLNADRGYGWDENPWVAAYTFRPILGNVDQVRP